MLFHEENPDKEVKVYAFLDDASDTTFITTQVQHALGIEGVETSFNLSTMLGRDTLSVRRVAGLIVKGRRFDSEGCRATKGVCSTKYSVQTISNSDTRYSRQVATP